MNTSPQGVPAYTANTPVIKITNPFSTTISISSGKELTNLTLCLNTMAGTRVGYWSNVSLSANGHIELPLPVLLPAGIYFLSYYNNDVSGCSKLVKTD